MRTGLVIVGAALTLVGAAVIGAVSFPQESGPITKSGSVWVTSLNTTWRTYPLSAVASGTATLKLTWSSSAPVSVSWAQAEPCGSDQYCVVGNPLASWTGGMNGSWTESGSSGDLYVVGLAPASNNTSVNFTAVFQETYRTSFLALAPLPFALTVAAGGVLIGIGGLATYLGLFLSGNPYRQPPPDLPPWDEADLEGAVDSEAVQEELRYRT